MKTLELETIELDVLSQEELNTVNGGIFQFIVAGAIYYYWDDIKAGFNDGWRDGHN